MKQKILRYHLVIQTIYAWNESCIAVVCRHLFVYVNDDDMCVCVGKISLCLFVQTKIEKRILISRHTKAWHLIIIVKAKYIHIIHVFRFCAPIQSQPYWVWRQMMWCLTSSQRRSNLPANFCFLFLIRFSTFCSRFPHTPYEYYDLLLWHFYPTTWFGWRFELSVSYSLVLRVWNLVSSSRLFFISCHNL